MADPGQAFSVAGPVLFGLADAHAPLASLAGLQAAGNIRTDQLLWGLLLALACNSLTRSVTALAAGGGRFARPVIAALALPLLVNTGVALLLTRGGA